jgi:uroporphyrinogen decarboxylase
MARSRAPDEKRRLAVTPTTHRERVLAALNHQEPDRVPIDLGATRNTGINRYAYRKLIDYLGIDADAQPLQPFGGARFQGLAKIDKRVLERFGVDTRGIFTGEADSGHDQEMPDGSYIDEFGVTRAPVDGAPYFDWVASPMADEFSMDTIRQLTLPDPEDPGYTRGLREEAMRIRQETDCALVLHLDHIIVHATQYIRGFENWFLDLALQPDLMVSLMDKILEYRLVVAERAIKEVADLIDVVSASDDVADQRGPLVSPDMYRRLIKPRHKRFFDLIHANTSARLLFHSCGSVYRLLPDFIEIGVDFINPVQVSCHDMETDRLKREFGADLGFWGAIDSMRVLPGGTPDDVRAEVERRIRDLGPEGGYVLAAVHNVQHDVPVENVIAMYDAALSYRL